MFNFLKRRKEPVVSSQGWDQGEVPNAAPAAPVPDPLDFSCPVTDEEREIVSVIASSILAGDRPESTVKVRSITGIDLDKEAAAAIVGAVLSAERSDTVFRLKSITEITQEA